MVIVIVILWGEHWVVSCPVVITSQREAWWGGPWSPVAGGGGLGRCRGLGASGLPPRCFVRRLPSGASLVCGCCQRIP